MKPTDKLADHLSYPPAWFRADRAAAYLSMSTNQFLKLVAEDRLPKSKRLGGMVFWDRFKLEHFVQTFEGDDVDASTDPFEKLLGNAP